MGSPLEAVTRHGAPATPSPRDSEEDKPRWSTGLTWIVSLLVLFMIARFVVPLREWPLAFAQDVWRWVQGPQIGNSAPLPAGLAIATVLFVTVAVEGWFLARLLVAGSALARERSLEIGLAIVLAISILGFGGLACVAIGRLGRLELATVYAITGGALALAWRGKRRVLSHETEGRSASRRVRAMVILAAVVATVVVAFSLMHAALSPVTEWDATIYHAEAARLWFLERPDPMLRFGPSIGIEISGNYPPLFPAAGAAVYTLIGSVEDTYLRILPPVLLGALFLMLFGFARQRFGPLTASLAVLLVVGSPLTLAYGVWTTGYMLLGALILAVVILVDLAAERNTWGAWTGAGIVAGLAFLSHFYGLLAVLPALAVLAIHGARHWRGALVFVGSAFLVASPWFLRNLILLGDPLYPLGSPPFQGKGLIEPFWSASKGGIKNAALGYWGGPTSPALTLRQFTTSLFDRQVLVTGAYFGLWFGFALWRRLPRAAYLAVFLAGAIMALLLPGWYWLRALVPIIAVGALLTAALLASLVASVRDRLTRHDLVIDITRITVYGAVAAAIVVSAVFGLSLAVAGPEQRTMAARPGDEVVRSVRNWGADRNQLWFAFSGDLLMWEWLNEHLIRGDRFATLEIRTYYLEHPESAFYLDGIEAVPLVRLTHPAAIERFLAERGIRYVAIPSWAHPGPLPLFRLLGSDRFPAVAAFPVGQSENPSVVYSVGPVEDEVRIGFAAASQVLAPPLDQRSVTFPAGDVGSRIFVPAPRSQPSTLRFDYHAASNVAFGIEVLSQKGSHAIRYKDTPTDARPWRTALIPLPPMSEPLVDLAVFPPAQDLAIRNVRLRYLDEPIVLAPRSWAHDRVADYRLPVGSGGRVYVPVVGGAGELRFEYRNPDQGELLVLVRNPAGAWRKADRTESRASRNWFRAVVELEAYDPGFVEVWLKPTKSTLVVRAIGTDGAGRR